MLDLERLLRYEAFKDFILEHFLLPADPDQFLLQAGRAAPGGYLGPGYAGGGFLRNYFEQVIRIDRGKTTSNRILYPAT
jgi:hypothetical protein